MKHVTEFLKEELKMTPVNEAFQSDIIRDIHDNMVKTSGSWWGEVKKNYKWDEITDADLVEMTPAEGKKKAYKRTETNHMLWIDANNQLIGITVANFKWNCSWREFGRIKSIMPIVRSAETCFQLLDADRFETSNLRRERQEARNNALALKDAQTVKAENMNRYSKMIAQKKVDGMTEQLAEVQARMDEATKLYTTFIDECATSMDEHISKFISDAKKANNEFNRILTSFESIEWRKGYIARQGADSYAYQQLISSIKTFTELVEKFISFYGTAQD